VHATLSQPRNDTCSLPYVSWLPGIPACIVWQSVQNCIAASVGDTGSAVLRHDIALVGDTPKSSMEQNSSPRLPVREQWDVDSNASYDNECDGGFEQPFQK
jgi:hypothetical protein